MGKKIKRLQKKPSQHYFCEEINGIEEMKKG